MVDFDNSPIPRALRPDAYIPEVEFKEPPKDPPIDIGYRAAVHLLESRHKVLVDQMKRINSAEVVDEDALAEAARQALSLDYAIGELRDAARKMNIRL